uniref:Uncharacterized protein n=1 Tax=Arundo donax TaxID=35708 RepID=A0A0A9AZI8_ARUDO
MKILSVMLSKSATIRTILSIIIS